MQTAQSRNGENYAPRTHAKGGSESVNA